jgi:hypothetical protein
VAVARTLHDGCRITDSTAVAGMKCLLDRFPTLWAEGVVNPDTPNISWSELPCVAAQMVTHAKDKDDSGFIRTVYAVAKLGNRLSALFPMAASLAAPEVGEPADSEDLGMDGGGKDWDTEGEAWWTEDDEDDEDAETEDDEDETETVTRIDI